ncbi:MAG TPA: hypothetical protein VMH40_22745 [Myxococcaceae bacterium]|nr:hypothetical protein [Myxococcaceae bacterium]
MPRPSAVLLAVLAGCASGPAKEPASAASSPLRFSVTLAPGVVDHPVSGRLLVVLSVKPEGEPREHVSDLDRTAQVFGIDVHDLAPGSTATLDGDVLGYPIRTLAALPTGPVRMQAVLRLYETFHRADGHIVELPPDRGEGQQWQIAPGNPASRPVKVDLDPARSGTVTLTLDHVLPPLPPTPDTKYVKHLRIKSELLSRFWGRDVYLGALVMVPEGWDTHPRQRYPVVVAQGHFGREFFAWRETPPDPGLPPADAAGIARDCPDGHDDLCDIHGYQRVLQEYGWRFHQLWTGPGFPRVLLVDFQHANPFFDDSYAVNSETLGPYGDALYKELLPEIERRFRGLGAWARGTYGGSTGGWEALAAQLLYPEEFDGVISNCPDPIDFRRLVTVDLYQDTNAYFSSGPFRTTPRVGSRWALGETRSTIEQENLKELVLGTRNRSGGQWDIWEAVFGPVGPDGYPRPLWDKRTGRIDPEAVQYAREHYDLGHILTRDWATLGPKLEGKLIEINVGRMDTFFLDGAVERFEERVRALKDPTPKITFAYGETDGHCWSGDRQHINAYSRLTYHERLIPRLVEGWLRNAPPGADVTGWRR